MVLELHRDPSNFAPCKSENEKPEQRAASVEHGRAGRIQRGNGIMKYLCYPEGDDFVFFDDLDESALKLFQGNFVLLFRLTAAAASCYLGARTSF